MAKKTKKISQLHHQINNLLSVVVIGLGLYLIIAPLVPALQFWWQKRHGFAQTEYVEAVVNNRPVSEDIIPDDNRIAIPSIGLNEPINEGSSLAAADTGPWRLPQTSTPPEGSNTVIVGHRFSYAQDIAKPFYSLDKVEVGNQIIIYWQKQVYKYMVVDKLVVTPNQTSIQDPTDDARLTLYTCTPLWTARNRLVIVAIPEVSDE